ncbi:MAG: SDR family NAD(P)-dependent oxidoreductase [Proteobacteria bacterium]|nr:SDR family NAD(P)-dependent oxidoreductase [Pseudomonadota bacterium]
MSTLAGKRIVITGSSRGLGRGFALEMAKAGARVVINGTQAEALAATESAIREAGGTVTAVRGSVAQAAVCSQLIQACVDAYGGIDVLINNAGQVRDRTLFKMSDEDFDEVIAVHLRGTFLCSRQAAIAMREQGGGHIINVVSNSGLSGGFGQSNYAAAKAGMMGLLHTWVLELARYGIRCNAFWPIAETDMTQVVFERAAKDASATGKQAPSPAALGFGTPVEVAQGMVWLASEARRQVQRPVLHLQWPQDRAVDSPDRDRQESFKATPWSVAELAAHYDAIVPVPVYQPRFVE